MSYQFNHDTFGNKIADMSTPVFTFQELQAAFVGPNYGRSNPPACSIETEYIYIAKGSWDTGKGEMYIDVKFVVQIMKSLTQPCFLPEGSATLCGVLPKHKLKRKKNKYNSFVTRSALHRKLELEH